MRWHMPIFVHFCAFLALGLGNPIPSVLDSRSETGLPQTLSVLANDVKAVGFLGAAGIEELDLLVSLPLAVSDEKIVPVASAEGARSEIASLVNDLKGNPNS